MPMAAQPLSMTLSMQPQQAMYYTPGGTGAANNSRGGGSKQRQRAVQAASAPHAVHRAGGHCESARPHAGAHPLLHVDAQDKRYSHLPLPDVWHSATMTVPGGSTRVCARMNSWVDVMAGVASSTWPRELVDNASM